MKALDTNLLVRFLVRDDEAQFAAVTRLLSEAEAREEKYFVTYPVLIEMVWVLARHYQCPREQVIASIEMLLDVSTLHFPPLVRQALRRMRESNIDLPDAIIGVTAMEAGHGPTLTFDRRAARSDLFEAV